MTADVEILIVEDSRSQALQLQHILEQHAYQVSVAHNGEEALAALKQLKPAVVVTDIVMPGMDGYELCRQIKANADTREVPVVLLTQLTDSTDIIKGLECGAHNFITKPYEEEFLLARIEQILLNQKLRRNRVSEMGMEIFFAGQKHLINSERMQIVDLLLSTYEAAMQKSRELEEANRELRTLRGLIPICAGCKKIRNDDGFWQQVEEYFRDRADVEFSHGLCPECVQRLYPDFADKKSGP